MKKIITALSFLAFGIATSSHAYLTHDQIVKSFQQNKPGKTPQMACEGKAKSCGPHPIYNKASEILPHGKKKAKKDARRDRKKHAHKKGGKK